MVIYVDGSYNKKRPKITGYAAVLVREERDDSYVVDIIYGATLNLKYVESANVGGELYAVEIGLKYANTICSASEDITIHYDYMGIGCWAERKWKTNKQLTKDYVEFIDGYNKAHTLIFKHVDAHSGVILNEIADKYAKMGICDYSPSDESHFLPYEIIMKNGGN